MTDSFKADHHSAAAAQHHRQAVFHDQKADAANTAENHDLAAEHYRLAFDYHIQAFQESDEAVRARRSLMRANSFDGDFASFSSGKIRLFTNPD